MSIWSGVFWKAVAERAVRTFAQVAAATLTADVTGLLDVDFVQVASVAGMATLLSVLMSVGSGLIPGNVGPGLTETPTGDAVPQEPDTLPDQLS